MKVCLLFWRRNKKEIAFPFVCFPTAANVETPCKILNEMMRRFNSPALDSIPIDSGVPIRVVAKFCIHAAWMFPKVLFLFFLQLGNNTKCCTSYHEPTTTDKKENYEI